MPRTNTHTQPLTVSICCSTSYNAESESKGQSTDSRPLPNVLTTTPTTMMTPFCPGSQAMSGQQLVDFQISREHVHSHVDEANHTELKLIKYMGKLLVVDGI